MVFFLTPFVLESLGKERYAVWILATSLTGYYGLLAFGLQGGVTQYLTRYMAARDYDRMNASASTAFVALLYVAGAVLAAAVATACVAPHIFQVSAENKAEVFWVILIVGFSSAMQFALFIFSAAFVATQRYDLSNLIGIGTRILSAALIWAAITLGYGLVGISLAMASTDSLGCLLRWRIAGRLMPQLHISRRLARMDMLRELFSYSTWNFLISIAQSIFMQVDALVIGLFMPLAAITPYSLAASLTRQLESVLNPISQVFFPVVTDLHARGETKVLKRVYLSGSRTILVVVAMLTGLAAFWAEDFFRLWLGPEYVSGKEYPSVAVLSYILLAAVFARFFPGVGGQILLGSLRVKPLAIFAFVEAMANLILSIVLIQFYGLKGVAVATLLSVVLFRSMVGPVLLARQLDTPWWRYVGYVLLRPLLVAALALLGAATIRHFWVPERMVSLLAQGLFASMLALPGFIFIGLNRAERQQIVWEPLRLIGCRFGRNNVDSKTCSNRFVHQDVPGTIHD